MSAARQSKISFNGLSRKIHPKDIVADMTSASLFDSACAALTALKAENRYRVFARLEKSATGFPVFRADTADGPRDVVVWASNDYFAMGCSSVVRDAVMAALGREPAPTRNIAGSHGVHAALEAEMAVCRPGGGAVVPASGYVAARRRSPPCSPPAFPPMLGTVISFPS